MKWACYLEWVFVFFVGSKACNWCVTRKTNVAAIGHCNLHHCHLHQHMQVPGLCILRQTQFMLYLIHHSHLISCGCRGVSDFLVLLKAIGRGSKHTLQSWADNSLFLQILIPAETWTSIDEGIEMCFFPRTSSWDWVKCLWSYYYTYLLKYLNGAEN